MLFWLLKVPENLTLMGILRLSTAQNSWQVWMFLWVEALPVKTLVAGSDCSKRAEKDTDEYRRRWTRNSIAAAHQYR